MRLSVVVNVLALLLAGPVMAEEYLAFQSPTGNIHCVMDDWGSGASARCDLIDFEQSYTTRPAGCDLDWGFAFGVDRRGKGYLACAGDTAVDRRNPVLEYGQAVSLGGISCVAAQTGMTCTNAEGHGFQIARARQKLF